MKRKILIVGYPKSGNTWLTRLTAEIVGCPSVGFWCAPLRSDPCIEGLDRASPYECYKAHHTVEQLHRTFEHYGDGVDKVIYVVRDPRDVLISASHFFRVSPRWDWLFRAMSLLPKGSSVYYRLLHSRRYEVEAMVRGLLSGTTDGAWMRVPWKDHVEGYLDRDYLVVRYEDLLAEPVVQGTALCDYLGVSRSRAQIAEAVRRQSFDRKREELARTGDAEQVSFLRKGEARQWVDVLTPAQARRIEERLGDLLHRLGYAQPAGGGSGGVAAGPRQSKV